MIRVKDINASLKFYTEIMDMKLDEKRRLDDCWLYCLSDKDNTCQIELTYNDDTPKNGYNIGNGFGHFAFQVESMEKFTEKIHTEGYDYLYEPFDLTGKGSKIAFIKDPDGYEIELIESVKW
jgi:lactoylglutathione lyase